MNRELLDCLSRMASWSIACGWPEMADAIAERRALLANPHTDEPTLKTTLADLERYAAGRGPFFDVPVNFVPPGMSVLEAQREQWELTCKLGEILRAIKSAPGEES